MSNEDLEALRKQAARVPLLERSLGRQKAVAQELERLVENRTRELYLAIEKIKRQGRLVGARTAIALLGQYGSLLRAAPSMLREFGEELGWESVQLWLFDAERDALICKTQWHAQSVDATAFHARNMEMEFVRGIGLPGRVLLTGTTEWIDIASDANFPRAREALDSNLRSGCAFPIIVDGTVHAVIEMFCVEPRGRDEDLVMTFTALGSQIGQVIERARTKQEVHDREHQIAKRIQTAILPRSPSVEGLELTAGMLPAETVGGDYYDILPFEGGAWLAIGDVSGHGVAAGMIMLMVQSALAGIVSLRAGASPAELVVALNSVIYDTIRRRLCADDHVTFTLLRYERDGTIRFAGAHEDLIVWRAATGSCEQISTPGSWLGAIADLRRFTTEHGFHLDPGDLLVLYTDGVTEARDLGRRQFGIERVCDIVQRQAGNASTHEIYDAIVRDVLAWGPQEDDITLVLGRKR